MPLTERGIETIFDGRLDARRIYKGMDGRMLVDLGGCSEFLPAVNAEMTQFILSLQPQVADVMILRKRTMVQKPRTRKTGTVNSQWSGVVSDPDLNGAFDMAKGIRTGREMLLYCVDNGVQTVVEFVNPIIEQYLSDVVVQGVIGARSVSAPTYREMASGSSPVISIKHTTDGDLVVAIDAIITAKHPDIFPGINPQTGAAAGVRTRGNKYTWLVLRGSKEGPNYDEDGVSAAQELLLKNGLPVMIGIDTNHAQTGKLGSKQPEVFLEVIRQRAAGNTGIIQTISEVNLVGGRQDIPEGLQDVSHLEYGKSVTDEGLAIVEAREMILEGAAMLRSARRSA